MFRSGVENREYDPSRRPRDILYPQKLALTSPTSGGRSIGIVRLWTKATELLLHVSINVCHPLVFTIYNYLNCKQMTAAARSKTVTVIARSNNEIVDPNPTRGISYSVCRYRP
jgi:hypothetical protein